MSNREERRRVNRQQKKIAEQRYLLERNGIKVEDLDKAYHDGIKFANKELQKNISNIVIDCYAAAMIALLDAGNDRDDAVRFINAMSQALATKIDSWEMAERILDEYGIRIDFDDVLDPIKLDPDWKPKEVKEE